MGKKKKCQIVKDKLQGFSVIDRNGEWCCSVTSEERALDIIKAIEES